MKFSHCVECQEEIVEVSPGIWVHNVPPSDHHAPVLEEGLGPISQEDIDDMRHFDPQSDYKKDK